MNEEPLFNPFTELKQESYIVEMRSMSGYSGSPVLLHIPHMSFRWRSSPSEPENGESNFVTGVDYQGLLGIDWGQIISTEKAYDTETERTFKIKMDTAMAGVVPIFKLMELIDSEEMKQMRQRRNVTD
jgi:hypothetical protein